MSAPVPRPPRARPCQECLDYLEQRGQIIGRAIATRAAGDDHAVEVLAERFLRGLHARHTGRRAAS